MQASEFSKLSDRILLRISIFLGGFMLAFYITRGALWALCISIAILALFELLSKIFAKYGRKQLTRKEVAAQNAAINALLPKTEREQLECFCHALKEKGFTPKRKKNLLLFSRADQLISLGCRFSVAPTSPDELLTVYREAREVGAKMLLFLSPALSQPAQTLIGNLESPKVVAVGSDGIYRLLASTGQLPKEETPVWKKPTFGESLKNACARKRFKGYFLSSLLLYGLSFFTPFALYYVILSTGLLLLSAVCLLGGKKPPEPEDPFAKEPN